MYPQTPNQDPAAPSPDPSEPDEPGASSFPQPTDAWPPRQDVMGDIEPSTEPGAPASTVSAAPAVSTDDLIRQAGPVTPSTATALGSQTRSGRRKPLLIGLIIAAVVVLGGGAAAYALYETPDQVMADSVMQLIAAKSLGFSGTGMIKSNTTTMSLTYSGGATQQEFALHGKLTMGSGSSAVTAQGDVQNDKDGNYYVRVANIKDILTSAFGSIPANEKATVDQIVGKVDNKWIKVAASDLPLATVTDATKMQQCYQTAVGKVQTDASYRNEILSAYGKQRFVVVKQNLGIKNMSIGYRLGIDATKEHAFVDSLSSTKLYSDLKKCNSDFTLDSYKIDSAAPTPEFELWANLLTHQPKQLSIMNAASDTSTTYNFTVNPVLNTVVKIDTPTDTTDIQQLEQALLMLTMAAYANGVQSRAEGTANQMHAVTLQKKVEAFNADTSAGNGNYPTYAQLMAATGLSEVPADVKALVVPRTAASGSEIGFVPCKDATMGGTITYIDTVTDKVQSIPYGSC